MDPRERFTAATDAYRRHRPTYPRALFTWIVEECGLAPGDCVVDIGCGTGISSRGLAAEGLHVIAIDPNPAMLAAAPIDGESEGEDDATKHNGGGTIEWRFGDAETLDLSARDGTLPRAIVGGQCFHWFDLDRALPRLASCIPADGRIVAFWNLRDGRDGFMTAYERLLLAACPEYAQVGAEPRAENVVSDPRLIDLRQMEWSGHRQRLDIDAFIGRVWSSSYVIHSIGDAQRPEFDAALRQLFTEHERDGAVEFVYRAVAYGFRVRDSAAGISRR